MTLDRGIATPDSGVHPITGVSMEDYSGLYRREFRPVARTVYLIVHDAAAAEDITQEAFLRLVQHWSKVEHYERPDAWVRRVAIRLATRYVRRERARGLLERRATLEPARLAGASADSPDTGLDVLRAVAQLPARQRAAVVLFYFEDRTVAEIVDLMGCTPSAAKVWLHRGRRRLAEVLAEEVPHDVA